MENNIQEVEQALNLGEDVNGLLKDKSNVLQLAVWKWDELEPIKPILDLLISKGLTIDNKNHLGHTALHTAIVKRKLDFIKYLIGRYHSKMK